MTAQWQGNALLRLTCADEPDVFTVRQRGREIAKAIGLDGQNQMRVAAALSDVGRDLVRRSLTAAVTFTVRTSAPGALVTEFRWHGGPPEAVLTAGWVSASRLMDEVHPSHSDGRGLLTMVKTRPTALPAMSPDLMARLRTEITTHVVTSPLDELRQQNQELLDALENVESKHTELLRLNEELEETNRGVLALYKELSEELEETNRGVVALYAELNEKSTQLRVASEAKTRFWSNISHELRGPLNSVIGLARLLVTPGSDPLTDEQHKQVDLINASGVTLLALVNELLDTAKAESGRLVPQLAPVDLVAAFLQLRGVLRSTVTSPDVRLVIDEPAGLPAIWTDETMLVRILRNVLSNALKFTEHGEVRLAVAIDDRNVVFTITDTGIGIPPDEIEKVFEEFHQVRSKLQTKTSGTGLGLPYARRLAAILAGDLTLTSALGHGTTVTLRLPHRDPADRTLPRFDSILVVDDDEDFRARLTAILTEHARAIRHVGDGRSALRTIAADKPGLVFLDLHMPGMNGREVLSVLRQKPDLRNIPVVVATSALPEGLDLTSTGLSAALLLKANMGVDTIALAISEAVMVLPRTVET